MLTNTAQIRQYENVETLELKWAIDFSWGDMSFEEALEMFQTIRQQFPDSGVKPSNKPAGLDHHDTQSESFKLKIVTPEEIKEPAANTPPVEKEKQTAKIIEFPGATKVKHNDDGTSVALLADGTKVKYETATGKEIDRKTPGFPPQVQMGVSRDASRSDSADSQKYPTLEQPVKQVGLDPNVVKKYYESKIDVSNCTDLTELVKVVMAETPQVVQWCIDNRDSVPLLQDIPPDKISAKITRVINLAI